MADLVLGNLVFGLFGFLATAGGFAIARHFQGRRAAVVVAGALLAFFVLLYAFLRLTLAPLLAPG
jgi:hypothetical protein